MKEIKVHTRMCKKDSDVKELNCILCTCLQIYLLGRAAIRTVASSEQTVQCAAVALTGTIKSGKM